MEGDTLTGQVRGNQFESHLFFCVAVKTRPSLNQSAIIEFVLQTIAGNSRCMPRLRPSNTELPVSAPHA
jgi:hypothetical protein